MDVTALQAATEDLAGSLSEVTVGDLTRAAPGRPGGVGALIEQLLTEDVELAAELRRRLGAPAPPGTDPDRRLAEFDQQVLRLVAAPDLHGGGFESAFRRTAAAVRTGFAAVPDSAAWAAELYWRRVFDLRLYARDVAALLGIEADPT